MSNTFADDEWQPEEAVSQIPVATEHFFKIDSRSVSLREYLPDTSERGTPSLLSLIGIIIKLLRIPIPSSTDDPCVASLAPFEIPDMPEPTRTRLLPQTGQLEAIGFVQPVYHSIDDVLHNTRTNLTSMRHISGQAIGRVHNRVWSIRTPPKDIAFYEFITPLTDGRFVWSLSSKADLAAPKNCRIVRKVAASAAELWALHTAAVREENKPILPVKDPAAIVRISEQLQNQVCDFHVSRGVFRALSPADVAAVESKFQSRENYTANGSQYAAVLNELQQLQNQKTNWGMTLLILLASAVFFIGAGQTHSPWKGVELLLLAGILLVHEFGHYIAMRIFGYRNLRMFFIPFFGAAVSGKNYNVPGWKKAIVSIMGPAPGILIGIALGVRGWMLHEPLLLKTAMIAIVINGLNLLPVLPLDGGWIMHAVLFSRHFILDVIFRVITAGLLLLVGISTGDRICLYLGIIMLLGLPLAIRLSRAATELRAAGLPPVSEDDQTIPLPTAQAIIDKLRAKSTKAINNKLLARQTLQVFESLNARPPNVLATIGFIGAQTGLIVLAFVAWVLILVAQRPSAINPIKFAALQPPTHAISPGDVRIFPENGPANEIKAPVTIIATYFTPQLARGKLTDFAKAPPGNCEAELFGESILLSMPATNDALRKQWIGLLHQDAEDVFVDGATGKASIRLQCTAGSVSAADSLAREMEGYLHAPQRMYLIPPWSTDDHRTSGQRAHDFLARETYVKLENAESGYTPAIQRIFSESSKAILDAERQGDQATVDRLRLEQKEKLDAIRQQAFNDLRAAGPDKIDHDVLEKYLAIRKANPGDKSADFKARMDNIVKELGPMMGQLPLSTTQPSAEAARFSTQQYATCTHEGATLNIHIMSFANVFDGAPALVRWLRDQGCQDMLYEFHLQPDFSMEDADEQ